MTDKINIRIGSDISKSFIVHANLSDCLQVIKLYRILKPPEYVSKGEVIVHINIVGSFPKLYEYVVKETDINYIYTKLKELNHIETTNTTASGNFYIYKNSAT
ncbi:MAG: hypothetical protein QXH07_02020 [Thermoplasmata archaeon]